MDGNVVFALLLTLFAGLATGIGSLLSLLTKRTNTKFLSMALGFSAGVMIYVSLVEIFVKAKDSLTEELGTTNGYWMTIFGFFAGMIFIAIVDRLLPKIGNPHEVKSVEDMDNGPSNAEYTKLMKMGVFTALAIGIHNFPEGIATFASALQDPNLGIAIAIAVAIHNIPEGIAVAVPIYYATGNRKKAFKLSFLSGLAEPVGAFVAYLVLMPFLNGVVFGVVFAAVAGIMVFISLDELLPAAKKYDETHSSIYGVVAGMLVMALSLVLMA
ncbi:zinc transporter ZupT [Psychrobacillus sp. NEAU-3TGS]|uniref:zinc transporter ZupT n=1 Tax=Psychrobacillus sp. NEAU-3TGS TaxID=2995412 RepID=UPI0024993B90|nr:zinc transporter ZupT [Psychrobacillus sp. NEAU-3TGS]MDI2585977.1 zinc transporter ZupT [Psychrobacillus sp. NEAU-3TGS]